MEKKDKLWLFVKAKLTIFGIIAGIYIVINWGLIVIEKLGNFLDNHTQWLDTLFLKIENEIITETCTTDYWGQVNCVTQANHFYPVVLIFLFWLTIWNIIFFFIWDENELKSNSESGGMVNLEIIAIAISLVCTLISIVIICKWNG